MFIVGGSQAAFTDHQSCGAWSGSVSSAHTHTHTHTAEKAERSHSVFNPAETQTSVSERLRLIWHCLLVLPGSLVPVSGASGASGASVLGTTIVLMDVKVGSMFVDDERNVSNVEVKGHTHCKERDDPLQ